MWFLTSICSSLLLICVFVYQVNGDDSEIQKVEIIKNATVSGKNFRVPPRISQGGRNFSEIVARVPSSKRSFRQQVTFQKTNISSSLYPGNNTTVRSSSTKISQEPVPWFATRNESISQHFQSSRSAGTPSNNDASEEIPDDLLPPLLAASTKNNLPNETEVSSKIRAAFPGPTTSQRPPTQATRVNSQANQRENVRNAVPYFPPSSTRKGKGYLPTPYANKYHDDDEWDQEEHWDQRPQSNWNKGQPDRNRPPSNWNKGQPDENRPRPNWNKGQDNSRPRPNWNKGQDNNRPPPNWNKGQPSGRPPVSWNPSWDKGSPEPRPQEKYRPSEWNDYDGSGPSPPWDSGSTSDRESRPWQQDNNKGEPWYHHQERPQHNPSKGPWYQQHDNRVPHHSKGDSVPWNRYPTYPNEWDEDNSIPSHSPPWRKYPHHYPPKGNYPDRRPPPHDDRRRPSFMTMFDAGNNKPVLRLWVTGKSPLFQDIKRGYL